jgi:hypothetical protein
METAIVGRKKVKPEGGTKPTALVMRGTEAWRDWLVRFADYHRVSVSQLTDEALAAYAKALGFPEKPPRR